MKSNIVGSLFARIKSWLFRRRMELEIFDRIAPHLQKEEDAGYSFSTLEEMAAETEAFDVREMLYAIERDAQRMPEAYGQIFRHIMHRDLSKRLRLYARLAERRVQPDHVDPRQVASRA